MHQADIQHHSTFQKQLYRNYAKLTRLTVFGHVPPGSPWASHPSMAPWTRRQFSACRMSAECQAACLIRNFHMCCWEGTHSSPSLQHLRIRRFLGHSFSKRVSLGMGTFGLITSLKHLETRDKNATLPRFDLVIFSYSSLHVLHAHNVS